MRSREKEHYDNSIYSGDDIFSILFSNGQIFFLKIGETYAE